MLVSVYLLESRALRRSNRFRRRNLAADQREFDSKKRCQHRDGVVAPQSSVFPNNVLGDAHDPTGHASIAGVFKFPSSPALGRGWMDLTGSVIAVVTEGVAVRLGMLARVKCKIRVVFLEVGLEGRVLSCSQARWRSCFSQRNHVIIHEVFFIARRVSVKFTFRHSFSVTPRHGHFLPMEVKSGQVIKSRAEWKDLSSC